MNEYSKSRKMISLLYGIYLVHRGKHGKQRKINGLKSENSIFR